MFFGRLVCFAQTGSRPFNILQLQANEKGFAPHPHPIYLRAISHRQVPGTRLRNRHAGLAANNGPPDIARTTEPEGRMNRPELPTRTASCLESFPGEMPRYSFKITDGRYQHPELTSHLSDQHAAYREGLRTFADLARDIAVYLQPDSEWQMEIADELGKPIFKLRFSSQLLA
jgi:hypothetical protein